MLVRCMQRRSIISGLLPVRANLRCCLDQLEHLLLASCGDDNTIQVWDLESGEHLLTLRRDRPYERLNITGIRGLTEAQKATLRALGAIECSPVTITQQAP